MATCSYPNCKSQEMNFGGVRIEPPLCTRHADVARAVGVLSNPNDAGQLKIITAQNVISLLNYQMPVDASMYRAEVSRLNSEISYFIECMR